MVKIKEWITELLIIKEYDLGSITDNNDFCKILTLVKLNTETICNWFIFKSVHRKIKQFQTNIYKLGEMGCHVRLR